jgi:predicted N-acyltransferase
VTELTAQLAGAASDIGETQWDALANPLGRTLPHPFTRFAFFDALERSGSATKETGWEPMHLIVRAADEAPNGKPVALMPLYRKTHSMGEYVFDHAWADALMRAGERYYPKLQSSVPFTPVPGNRLLIASGQNQDEVARVLLDAGKLAVAQTRSSSLHITFMREKEWQLAGTMDFLQRTDQQFHWENRGYQTFDDFLSDLTSSKRKNIRKERAGVAADDVTFEWRTGDDLNEGIWDAFFDCYIMTASRKWNDPYLTRAFFSQIGQTMGDQILLVMAKRNGRFVAGALNLFDDETLYGRNWGCVESIPFLHFEACYYQAIEFAIERGLKRVEAGAQGGHKLLRGYLPSPTYSAHYILHEGLRRAVAKYLHQERGAVAEHMKEMSELAPFKKPT